jgi:hypothetical protein
MESSIVVLRDRGRRELRRAQKAVLITIGVGAAAGVVVIGVVLVRRIQRPPTRRERIERVIPLGWWDRLQAGFARQVPPIRISVGQKEITQASGPRWEERAATIARSFGAGVASGVATRIATLVLMRLAERAEAVATGAEPAPKQAETDQNDLRNPDRGRTPS